MNTIIQIIFNIIYYKMQIKNKYKKIRINFKYFVK